MAAKNKMYFDHAKRYSFLLKFDIHSIKSFLYLFLVVLV